MLRVEYTEVPVLCPALGRSPGLLTASWAVRGLQTSPGTTTSNARECRTMAEVLVFLHSLNGLLKGLSVALSFILSFW